MWAGEMVTPTLGRPSCAVLPQTLQDGSACFSLGCQGNRVFTDVSEHETYLAIPGERWPAVVERALEVREANRKMFDFYSSRQGRFAQTADI